MRYTALDAATLEKLISAAVAAPSIHNTQPWRYRLDPDTSTIEVSLSPERRLPLTDPEGRALHLSIGASLFNLRVAAAHHGWEPVVRLLPYPSRPALVASVRLAGPPGAGRSPGERDLYETVWRRHTSRLPFTDRPVSPEALAELVEAAAEEGATLSLPDPEETDRVLQLTAEAERRNTTDPERGAESRAWITGAEAPYGLPESALGPQDTGGRVPVRDFSALRPADHLPPQKFEDQPVIAVLSTEADQPADWIRAGQALERVLLVATHRGLRASVLHQALEWPDLRWALRDTHSGPSYTQLVLRLGYGPEGPATPRATIDGVLEGGIPE